MRNLINLHYFVGDCIAIIEICLTLLFYNLILNKLCNLGHLLINFDSQSLFMCGGDILDYKQINTYLVDIFNKIMIIEEMSLKTSQFNDVSLKEMHTVDIIGKMPM